SVRTTIAAAIYLKMAGRPPVLPSNQLSYTENFLYIHDSLFLLQTVVRKKVLKAFRRSIFKATRQI
ncbi:hypothetical protein S83_056112, partial [Arachis hypogaea]